MRITRSKTTKTKKESLIDEGKQKSNTKDEVPKVIQPLKAKRKPSNIHKKLLNEVKYSITSTKPSYYHKKPSGKLTYGKIEVSRFLKTCTSILNPRLLEIEPNLGTQLNSLQNFKIFKDMNRTDMKTVQILMKSTGVLKERDSKLETLLRTEETTEKPSENFYKFFGIEIDKDI